MTAPSGDDASEGDETPGEQSDPAQAFAALSDPLRVDILRELSAHQRTTGEAVIGFADLRRRVDVRDSGRFRYHLNQLRDHFVEKADEGYQLTHAGVQVVGAILAGTYTNDVSMGPVELDSDCSFCGQPAVATCEDSICLVTCPNDHTLFQWSVPPNATTDATLPEIVDLAEVLAFQAIEQALLGVCPQCYDTIETSTVVDGVPRPAFRADCETCGGRIVGPVGFCLLVDPAVAAFCRRHGLTLRDNHVWEFPFVGEDAEVNVVDNDPLRFEFIVMFDGATLSVVVNESGHVLTAGPPNDS